MYDNRSHTPTPNAQLEGVTIRLAGREDRGALDRLAQLDSASAPPSAEMVVGELDGELVAAVSLAGDYSIADPFRRTIEVIALLKTRARQLRGETEPDRRSRRSLVRWRRLA